MICKHIGVRSKRGEVLAGLSWYATAGETSLLFLCLTKKCNKAGAAAARYKVAPSRCLVPRRQRLSVHLPKQKKEKMLDAPTDKH